MKHAFAAAGITLGLVGPLAAQTAPPAPPEQAAQPPAAQPPATQPSADPQTDRQRNSAAKLAGMIRFVAVSCPDAEPDYDRFKAVISSMRVDIKDLENGPLMATSLGYSQAYQKEPEESCKRAFEHFGENGTTIPKLLAKKDPSKAPDPAKPADAPKAPEAGTTSPPAATPEPGKGQ